MLTSLRVKDFKAFEKLDLEIKPITIFIGPNNSGKSSIIAALRVLVQTIESYDAGIPLLLNGPMGDFGTYKDIIFKNNTRRQLGIGFSIKDSRPQALRISKNIPVSMDLKYKYRTQLRELTLKEMQMSCDKKSLISTLYLEDSQRQVIQTLGNTSVPTSEKSKLSKVIRFQNFIPASSFIGGPLLQEIAKNFSKESYRIYYNALEMVSEIGKGLNFFFRKIEYVGAMRLPPSRSYLFSGDKYKKVGASGQNTAAILGMDSMKNTSKSKNLIKNISAWMAKAGIASGIKVEALSDRHYELKIQHPKTKEYQNFADVGYGNSQILPVLVGGYNLESESLYLVEQPEIHLHPKAQAELGDFFLDLFKREIQTIIETHSEHMILRLQQHVANKLIAPEDIIFYYIYADGKEKKSVKLELDKNGSFIQKWPEGFFPERLEEAKKLAKARYQG